MWWATTLEMVRRLTPLVRDRRAGYELSLFVLRTLKELSPKIFTKSSLLLGLGETEEEVEEALWDLREAGVDIVVLGQYLAAYSPRAFGGPLRSA
jgi:lipoic acid synthetase